ncbi:MAG: MBL fold metallo-hydrolase [Gemmatimonadota bacterium]|nr:MBL fold metallo-hydrolase [Gemmatimonadota bacterium]
MQVTILGTGTLVPHPERGAPGLAVSAGSETLLFDIGSGALYRAAKAGIDWSGIAHIFLTHYHADHTLDLVSFLFACNYTPGARRQEKLNLYGPSGLREFYRAISAAWPSVKPLDYELELRELDRGEAVGAGSGWEVRAAAMAHGDTGALAYRVDWGNKCMVYSGDTEYCEALVEVSRGADLLVCECSTDDRHRAAGHLSPEGVVRLVRETGLRRVLLTHVYPPLDPGTLAAACARGSGAQVEAAVDMAVYEV